jgi:hypothetical protein
MYPFGPIKTSGCSTPAASQLPGGPGESTGVEVLFQVAPSFEVAYPIWGVVPLWFRPVYHMPNLLPTRSTEGVDTLSESHALEFTEGESTGPVHSVHVIPSVEVA